MPVANEALIDPDLEQQMALAQNATSMVLSLRRKVNIKVRQPLSKLVIPVLDSKTRERLEAVKQLILGEVNVKDAEFVEDSAGLVTKKIKPNFKTLGKRYGARMKEIAAAFATLDQDTINAIQKSEVAAQAYTLALAGGEVVLEPGDFEISSEDMPGWLVANDGPLTLALDVTLTPELVREGIARELVNRIQNLRKDTGFEVTDKVDVCINATGDAYREISEALADYKEYVASQTLAVKVSVEEGTEGEQVEWNDGVINIKVTKN